MARKKSLGAKSKREAFDVTCECTKQTTPRIGENCQCFITVKGPSVEIKTEIARLLKVDKLQI